MLRAEAGFAQQQLIEQIYQCTVATWQAWDATPRRTMQVKIAQLFRLPDDCSFNSTSEMLDNDTETSDSTERKLMYTLDDAILALDTDTS